MIRLFRKIRQNLLSEKNYSLYFLYATGEIILVVVGILIAFQIDNWNEQRKFKSQEIKTLTEVKSSLEIDLKDIIFNISWQSKAKNSCETILNSFNQNLPYNDSLAVHFGQMMGYSIFLPNIGSYEYIKTKGIDMISNDSLRIKLTHYYEQDIKLIHAFENLNQSGFPQTVEMYYANFDKWKFLKSAIPRDYNGLSGNAKFKSYLYSTATFRENEIEIFKTLQQNCSELIIFIEEELIKNK